MEPIDTNNDETFGEHEDELNEETFGEEDQTNWDTIQQNSSDLEKLKVGEKKPFGLMSFGKPSPSKGFSTNLDNMFNLTLDGDGEEEEEEELIIPQSSTKYSVDNP
jgi:hypothetical protein